MPSPGTERAEDLAAAIGGRLVGPGGVRVNDVSHDSRAAAPGVAYVAIRGFTRDGHRFVDEVVRAGSPLVIVERRLDVDVTQIVVGDSRAALGPAAAFVHGHPSRSMSVVGVTGTNGKTSVTAMLASIARAAGRTPGVIGTLGVGIGDEQLEGERTTPEASDFQRLLATMRDRSVDIVAAEVSSHALALGRVEGTRFAIGAFTNLTQDHLDFHGVMEAYFRSKASLFDTRRTERAVVWTDDSWGERLSAEVGIPVTTVGIDSPADVRGAIRSADLGGSTLELALPGSGPLVVRVPIPGRFSVANAMVAAACARLIDIEPAEVVVGLEATPPIPGRFEVVSAGPVAVVVDYSHTPAGIEAAIATARPLTAGRVIAVLGAGGDRDRDKRPVMGAAASAADLVVVTSDNPRSEPPAAIMASVSTGVTAPHIEIVDRRAAIHHAVKSARPGDTVLVMGKGHETYQETAEGKVAFDDRQVSREALAGRDPG